MVDRSAPLPAIADSRRRFVTGERRTGGRGTERKMRNVLGGTLVLLQALMFGAAAEPSRAAESATVRSQAQGAQRPLPPSLVGAFVPWGQISREHNLRQWEAWLRQRPSTVLAMDFYGQTTWADFKNYDWLPGFWAKANPNRHLVWSIPLTVKGTPLADVADGLHDEAFQAAASAISIAQPDAIIRLGWEMNSTATDWFAGGREADYIRAFRRVVEIFRQYSRQFRFDWCISWGPQDSAADKSYPGDDVVDYVGLDIYDYKPGAFDRKQWDAAYVDVTFGLAWQARFAADHNKKMSFPEWGVGHAGDNPYFIEQMHSWFVDHQRDIAYAAYFDVNGAWPTQIDNDQFPRSRSAFQSLFSGTTPR
jgi:hypothetical protein